MWITPTWDYIYLYTQFACPYFHDNLEKQSIYVHTQALGIGGYFSEMGVIWDWDILLHLTFY